MQHQCAQCQADKHGGEDVEDGFSGHGLGFQLLFKLFLDFFMRCIECFDF
jgi:hypothetical protein